MHAGLTADQAANIVLGQRDLSQGSVNQQNIINSNDLLQPYAAALDSNGNLWVADSGNNRILEYTSPFSTNEPASVVLGQTGFISSSCSTSSTNLCDPTELVFDSSGNLWASDSGNNRVLEFPKADLATDGAASVVIGEPNINTNNRCGSTTSNTLCDPTGISFDSHGNLWIADQNNNRVLEFPSANLITDGAANIVLGQSNLGTSACAASSTALCHPSGLAFDSANNLWVADQNNNRVLEFPSANLITDGAANTSIGQLGFSSKTCATSSAALCHPAGVSLDSQGNLWIADTGNNRVLEFPGQQASALTSGYSSPYGVAFAPNGQYAYVTNFGYSPGQNVVIVNTATNAVVGSINSAAFYEPTGVAFAPNGQYAYVAQYGSGNILIVNTATNTVVNSINSAAFNGPTGIAFAPNGQYAYVTNRFYGAYGNGNMAIINTATNTVVGSIEDRRLNMPFGVAFAPNGQYAYVTNYGGGAYGNGNVVIISTATNTIVGTIEDPSLNMPKSVAFAPNGQYAYVSNFGYSSNVVIVNTATNAVVGSINGGFVTPVGIAFAPNGQYAYVANYGADNMVIVGASNVVASTVANGITCGESPYAGTIASGSFDVPFGVAMAPNGQYAYIPQYGSDNILIVGTATNTIVNSISSAAFNNLLGAAISPNGAYSYAINDAANAVMIISTATNTVTNTIVNKAFYNVSGVAFAPNGQYAYVTNQGTGITGNMIIINTATNTVVGSINSGSFDVPFGVAFAPNGQYAYVTNYAGKNVLIVSTATNTIVGSINSAAFYEPSGIAFAPNGQYAYVANYGDGAGNVAIISTATNTVTNALPYTFYGPSGVAFSNDGSFAYIVNQNFGLGDIAIIDTSNSGTAMSCAYIVVGQQDFTHNSVNQQQANTINSNDLSSSYSATFDPNGNLWVADTNNNRVLEFKPPFSTNEPASVVLGQPNFLDNSCGVSSTLLCQPEGIAFDSANNLWVSDSGNSRVLEFPSANLITGGTANVVIGQSSLGASACATSSTALCNPTGIAFDSAGNLWVADSGNSRVLEFLKANLATDAAASVALGQINFNGNACGTTSNTLCNPTGVTFDLHGNLWVADQYNNRVLEFPSANLITNGAANVAIGELNLNTNIDCYTSPAALCYPTGIAFDSAGDLWVADSANNRVLEFPSANLITDSTPNIIMGQPNIDSNACATSSTALCNPAGIAFDSSGNLWIADTGNNRVPEYMNAPSTPATSVSCPSFTVGQTTTCTATLTGGFSPTGTVAFSTNSATGSFAANTCTISSSQCQVTYTDNAVGTPKITAVYSGDINNTGSQGTNTVTVNQATPTTSVSCPSFTVDQSTTCTATLTGGFSPSGTVTFSTSSSSGSFTVASCTLASGQCHVTYTDTAAGSPTITATYSGDQNNAGSQGTNSLTINQATPTISVSCPSFTANALTTCTATLTGGFSPTGTVSFSTNSASGSFTANSCTIASSQCQVTYTDNAAGMATITAAYGGDQNNAGSQGTNSVTINKAAAGTSVSCPLFTVDQSTTCTVSVTGDSPTGTVTFSTNSATGSFTVASCTLASGQCHVAYTDTAAGRPTITATYGGDHNNAGSQGTTQVTIDQATPTATASCPSFVVGQHTTCTATMTGGFNPSGTVDFSTSSSSGSFTSNPCTISSGQCQVMYFDTAADPTITATYSGDQNNAGSQGTNTVTVNQATTAASVSCSSFAAGSTTTCTATLTGGFNPTGTFNFGTSSSTGSFTTSSCTIASSQCHVIYTDNAVGTPTITATYSGDQNNAGSQGTAQVTVNQPATTTTISSGGLGGGGGGNGFTGGIPQGSSTITTTAITTTATTTTVTTTTSTTTTLKITTTTPIAITQLNNSCILISNVTTTSSGVGFSINGQSFNLTDIALNSNFTTVVINGVPYILYRGTPQTLVNLTTKS